MGSSQTRARTRVPCIGRQILNHCATREALGWLFQSYVRCLVPPYLPLCPCGISSARASCVAWFFSQRDGLRGVTRLLWPLASMGQEVEAAGKHSIALASSTAQSTPRACPDSRGWKNRSHLLSGWGEGVCGARSPCRKAYGMGDITAVIFGKYSLPLLNWQGFFRDLTVILGLPSASHQKNNEQGTGVVF